MKKTWVFRIFFVLVVAVLLSPLILSRELLFPYITTRAFYLRGLIELALPLYAYILITRKECRPNLKNPLHIFILLFLFFTIAASVFGVNQTRSLWGNFERMGGAYYTAHLVALYFYVVALGQAGGGYIKKILQWAIAVAGVVSFEAVLLKMGILSKAIGLSYLAEQGHVTIFTTAVDPSMPERASVTLGNPIFLASLLIIPFFFAIYFGLQEEGWGKRTLYFVAAFFQFIAIVLSGTRGAIVGLVIGVFTGLVAFLFINRRQRSGRYGLGVLGLFLVVVGVLFYFHRDLPAGSTLYRLFNLKDSNSSARLIQWKSAITGFPDRPWLGVGPENYYVISNKYYDPKIYQYDPSWFDKPHNYLLEILVTTGVFGFAAYAGLMVFAFWALLRAFRVQFFSTVEFCLLVAAMLAYQIQNLFVFDTISASLMFYVFIAFCAFLWHESSAAQESAKKSDKNSKGPSNRAFAAATAGVLLVVMAYAVYVTNAVPAEAARDVNYGYAYAAAGQNQSPSTAEQYKIAADDFKQAADSPFNFDLSETGSRYVDFVTGLVQSPYGQQNPQFTKDAVNSALALELEAETRSPNDPIVLQKFASLYLYKSMYVDKSAIDPHAESYARQAVNMAPNRLEPHLFLAQIKIQENDFPGAEDQLLWVKSRYPTVREGRWQLAGMYYLSNRIPEALAEYQENIKAGILPQHFSDVQWLVQYYEDNKQFDKAQSLLQQLIPTDQNDLALYENLVRVYAVTGQKDLARNLAEEIMKADPSQQQAMQAILNSLK